MLIFHISSTHTFGIIFSASSSRIPSNQHSLPSCTKTIFIVRNPYIQTSVITFFCNPRLRQLYFPCHNPFSHTFMSYRYHILLSAPYHNTVTKNKIKWGLWYMYKYTGHIIIFITFQLHILIMLFNPNII